MIAKVQPSKRKSGSSFKRLLNYLTMERDPETGKTLLRGDVVMSHNLVGIDTAAAEMKGQRRTHQRPAQSGTVRHGGIHVGDAGHTRVDEMDGFTPERGL